MDKYELVLDIVEHPDNYTSEQLSEILSDSDTVEIYNLICNIDSAMEAGKKIDVDAEWKDFLEKHPIRHRRSFLWFGSHAASIVAIISTSIAAVAAVIAVTVTMIAHEPKTIAGDAKVVASVATNSTDTKTAPADTIRVEPALIVFEDKPLEAIMKEVAMTYGVEVKFNNKESASLRLYYKLDPALPLDEIVSQLNTFEQINITRKDNTLTID